jgi:hypothetical protein
VTTEIKENKKYMAQTFKLKKGEILFENDRIIISDKVNKQNGLTLLTSGIWIFYGTLSVLRYMKTGDEFLLWTGSFIGIGHLIIFVFTLLRSTKSEISLTDVKSIKVKQRFNNYFLDIRLKNNRLRRVNQIEDSEELEEYIKTNYGGLTTKRNKQTVSI